MENKKVLLVRNPSATLRVAGAIYFIVGFVNFLAFLIFWLLLLGTAGVYIFSLFNTETDLRLVILGLLSATLIVGGLSLIFYLMRDNLYPETEKEKLAVLFSNQIAKHKSLTEVIKTSGRIVKVTHSLGSYRFKLKLDDDKGTKYNFDVNDDISRELYLQDENRVVIPRNELLSLVGKDVVIRQSSVKVKKYGWIRDHISISVKDDSGRVAYKFEGKDPCGKVLRGKKIFG